MNTRLTDSLSVPFYLLVISVPLFIIAPDFLSEGMFMDGLIYSTVAKNLSNGLGSFWNLHFSETYLSEFHEHPPLAFWLQSIFFTIFGDSRYVDKLYSFLTFASTGYIITKIWKQLGYQYGWFPLLLWVLMPRSSWASTNNILENTVTVFTSLSVLWYLKSQDKKRWLFIFLSGSMLAFGFLTKGFVAFFPWTFPFFYWLFLKKKIFSEVAFDSAAILLSTLMPLILLILFYPEARISLHKYLDTQVLHSLKYITTVDSRWSIIMVLAKELAIPFFVCVFLIGWIWIKKFSLYPALRESSGLASAFILLGLSGVLPITISMKQSGFYILATFPFFAIGLSVLIYPFLDRIMQDIQDQSNRFLYFKWVSVLIFFIAISYCLFFANKMGRDKNQLTDVHAILTVVPEGTVVNIHKDMCGDWSLHGYCGRYKNISLEPAGYWQRDYFLIHESFMKETDLLKEYEKVQLKTTNYFLFRKK